MSKIKIALLLSICLIVIVTINNSGSSINAIEDKSTQFYTIDGFEKPGEWMVKFSKFRSAQWGRKDDTQKKELDKDWYGWFPTDDKNLKKREILPTFIYKNNPILKEEVTILGMKTRWDKKGYNWISIEPNNNTKSDDKERYSENKIGRYPDQVLNNHGILDDPEYINYNSGNYILIPARSTEIGLFVWSNAKTQYTLEFHLEDSKGTLYSVNAGDITFKGWRRITAEIPFRIVHSNEPAKLKRIRLISNPKDTVLDGTYIYMDYLHSKIVLSGKDFLGKGLENSKEVWKHRISN